MAGHRPLERLWWGYVGLLKVVCASLVAGVVGLTLANVLARWFNHPIVWADELSRFAFVWLAFVGAALGVASESHFRVSLVRDSVDRNLLQSVLQWLAIAIGCAVFITFAIRGFIHVRTNLDNLSPALRVPMGYVYLAIPVSGVLMLLSMVGRLRFGRVVTPEDAEVAPEPPKLSELKSERHNGEGTADDGVGGPR